MKFIILTMLFGAFVSCIKPVHAGGGHYHHEHNPVPESNSNLNLSVPVLPSSIDKAFAVSGAVAQANSFGMENYKLQFTGGWTWYEDQNGFAVGIGQQISPGFLIHGTVGSTVDGEGKQYGAGFRRDF